MVKVVNCPQCETPVEWRESSEWRPFCSERCKMIDLGAWAAEEYGIASENPRPLEESSFIDISEN